MFSVVVAGELMFRMPEEAVDLSVSARDRHEVTNPTHLNVPKSMTRRAS